jgi:hypothetical protein
MSEEQNSAPVFRIGQKVVCVDDGPSAFGGEPTNVKKGCVYTISYFGLDADWPCVLLAELNPPGFKAWYNAQRFRPVVERKTDISIFTAMLNPSRKKVTA